MKRNRHKGAWAFGPFATVLLALTPALTSAQKLVSYSPAEPDTTRQVNQPIIRVGKWVTLAAAAGAAAWGVASNREADNRYEDLERICRETPTRCTRQSANGAFNDAALEQEYQDILKLDDRAKYALAVGQVAIATSVILFILDLPQGARTEDIPYDPKLRLLPGGVGFRFRL